MYLKTHKSLRAAKQRSNPQSVARLRRSRGDLGAERLRKAGFTIIEILIVVGIISILSVIAFPNILRARLNANEMTARANLRAIRDALESYKAAHVPPVYPADLPVLASETPPYLDSTVANATALPGKQGYLFEYTLVGGNQYTVTASPALPGVTGNQVFSVDEDGEIQ